MFLGRQLPATLRSRFPVTRLHRTPAPALRAMCSVSPLSSRVNRVTILWGSQTGTATWFANLLQNDLRGVVPEVVVEDAEEYDVDDLSGEDLVVFIMACYGEGQATDNAEDLYDYIKDGCDGLHGVKYAVFGLGNSKTYPDRYQVVGRTVNDRLEELGATRVMPRGEGDNVGTIDDDFEAWKTQFVDMLLKAAAAGGGDGGGVGDDDATAASTVPAPAPAPASADTEPPFTVHLFTEADLPRFVPSPAADLRKAATRVRHVPMVDNHELYDKAHPDRASCRHVAFDVTHTDLTQYESGDHLAVFPHNCPTFVHRLADRLGVNLDTFFLLNGSGAPSVPQPYTLRAALSRQFDLHSAPAMGALQRLASFATNPDEQRQLKHLGTDVEAYNADILSQYHSTVHVLELFKSLDLPLWALLDTLPPSSPRFYSISSSPLMHPNAIHLSLRVVSSPKPSGSRFLGKASRYLASSPACDLTTSVAVTYRKSDFRLPADPATPVIMVGGGTGLAPLRAFLQHRAVQGAKGATDLYFGCFGDYDELYADELAAFKDDGTLTELHVVKSEVDRQFVQDRMEENRARVKTLIEDGGAHVYVCGNAQTLAKGVEATLAGIVGEDTVTAMQGSRRYQQDIY